MLGVTAFGACSAYFSDRAWVVRPAEHSRVGLHVSPVQMMAQIQPWYSIRQRDRNVYHDDDRCPIGKEIDLKYRKKGRRCRTQCPSCAKLQAESTDAERLARLTPF